MIYLNELMKKKIGEQSPNNKNIEYIQQIISHTTLFNGCIIYDGYEKDDFELQESQLDFNEILEFYGDRTGYETACNEVWIDYELIEISEILSFLRDIAENVRNIALCIKRNGKD